MKRRKPVAVLLASVFALAAVSPRHGEPEPAHQRR